LFNPFAQVSKKVKLMTQMFKQQTLEVVVALVVVVVVPILNGLVK